MFLDPQSFIIFVGAFIVCSALLGMIFFTGDDFQVLRRMAGMPARPISRGIGNSPAAVTEAITEAAAEAEDEGEDDDDDDEEPQPEGDSDGATQTVMKFLEGSIAHLIKEKIQISGADKFGANLFLPVQRKSLRKKTSSTISSLLNCSRRLWLLLATRQMQRRSCRPI